MSGRAIVVTGAGSAAAMAALAMASRDICPLVLLDHEEPRVFNVRDDTFSREIDLLDLLSLDEHVRRGRQAVVQLGGTVSHFTSERPASKRRSRRLRGRGRQA